MIQNRAASLLRSQTRLRKPPSMKESWSHSSTLTAKSPISVLQRRGWFGLSRKYGLGLSSLAALCFVGRKNVERRRRVQLGVKVIPASSNNIIIHAGQPTGGAAKVAPAFETYMWTKLNREHPCARSVRGMMFARKLDKEAQMRPPHHASNPVSPEARMEQNIEAQTRCSPSRRRFAGGSWSPREPKTIHQTDRSRKGYRRGATGAGSDDVQDFALVR
ncbi:hypothetical protein C8R47DRAFT_1076810 [Mycena vitilis]|nr:hypothetical protein C8R47DRAFT_1076810 [Mycena vitilis]